MLKTLYAAVLALALTAVAVSAQTVEVVLMEDPGTLGDGATRLSEFLIAGCLDSVFEAGVIGTNERPRTGTASDFLAYKPGPNEAEALVDYVIVVLAVYAPPSGRPGEAITALECRYRCVRVADGAELAIGSVPVVAPASASDADMENAYSAMGSRIAGAVLASCRAAL